MNTNIKIQGLNGLLPVFKFRGLTRCKYHFPYTYMYINYKSDEIKLETKSIE